MKVKKAILVALCGASLLAVQPAYTFSFGALFTGISTAWLALPKRAVLVGVLCLMVWKWVSNKFGTSQALCGQLCSICQEEFKSGDDIVTCKEIYGGIDGDKHGFHRKCIFDDHGELKGKKCSVCRATKNPDAAHVEEQNLRDYVATRDIHRVAVDLQATELEERPAPITWWNNPFAVINS